ncbi:MAG TPA: VOC family protein [Candidatus Binatia bacterium]|nr:VOC family protein [Candidatus Binatia bacterium]
MPAPTTPLPAMRVDHVSIAVPAIDPALALFRRILPVRMRREPTRGYDGDFRWTDFFVGDWKLELIESARPVSFVERFIARRGPGFHHLSLDVEEDALAGYTADLERAGLRIVDRGDYGNGDATAFISPRTSPGILVQFWQVPGFHGARPNDYPTEPVATKDGVGFRVRHLGLAVRSIDDALAWFRRFFRVDAVGPRRRSQDGLHEAVGFWIGDWETMLVEPARPGSAADRFLARRGPGFHHLAIDVDPLARLVAQLDASGVRVLEGRDGDGRPTAFVRPRDACGVLLHFRQGSDLARPRRP